MSQILGNRENGFLESEKNAFVFTEEALKKQIAEWVKRIGEDGGFIIHPKPTPIKKPFKMRLKHFLKKIFGVYRRENKKRFYELKNEIENYRFNEEEYD